MNVFSRFALGAALLGGVWLVRSGRLNVKALVVEQMFEKPARKRRYAELADDLQVSGERVKLRLERARGSEAGAETLRHIIGIERWGQRRLRVAQGEPFAPDGHQPYKPPHDASWEDLKAAFLATRAETVALARALSDAPPPQDWRVAHNGFGPLSARAWLRYLRTHAELESRRIR